MNRPSAWIAVAIFLGLIAPGCEKALSESFTPTKPSTTDTSSSSMPAQPTVAPDEIVAKINDRLLSKRDVELAVQQLRAATEMTGRTWTPLPTEAKAGEYSLKDLVSDLIIADLRAQDAIARGLHRNPDVQQVLWYTTRTMFAQEWVKAQLDRATVTQAEIDQFYKDNQPGFREPERIKIRQLVVNAEEPAKATLVKLLEGTDFAALSQQISIHPDAAKPPLSDQWVMRSAERAALAAADPSIRELRDPVLEQAAFAIDKVGGVSSYVKGADGNYHIFQLVERQPGRQKTLLEVADNIRNYLRLQHVAEATEQLKTKAKIDRFDERLGGITQ